MTHYNPEGINLSFKKNNKSTEDILKKIAVKNHLEYIPPENRKKDGTIVVEFVDNEGISHSLYNPTQAATVSVREGNIEATSFDNFTQASIRRHYDVTSILDTGSFSKQPKNKKKTPNRKKGNIKK